MKIVWLVGFFLFIGFAAHSQGKFQGDSLVYGKLNGKDVRSMIGHVVFKQPEQTLYSDRMDEYTGEKVYKFIGNVRIEQANGGVITGDSLLYDKETKFAQVIGNVHLVDNNTDLVTDKLNYNTITGLAYYTTGAVIKDGNTTMRSKYGEYNRNTKEMYFTEKIDLNSTDGTLQTDTLRYNTITKVAKFFGPTTISNKDGVVKAIAGEYNTETKESKFYGRSRLDNKDYYIEGDRIDFNRTKGKGAAMGNVLMISKTDSITIYGDESKFDNSIGYSKVWGRTKVRFIMQKDSLFMLADTLLSTKQSDSTKRILRAYHHVKLYKTDMQATCDSLAYNASDSAIRLFVNPVLWNGKNQITGDSIKLQMALKKLESMLVQPNAFVIQQDTLGNFNQLKGRQMTAYFKSNKITRVDVNGNGQNIYFALENDTVLTGMNKVVCANMIVHFDESNKVSTINFIKDPEALFIPPHELAEPDKKLRGFKWLEKDKPTFMDVLAQRASPKIPAKPKSKAKKGVKSTKPVKKTKKPAINSAKPTVHTIK